MSRQQRRAAARKGGVPRDASNEAVIEAGPIVFARIEKIENNGGSRADTIAVIVHPSHPSAPTLSALQVATERNGELRLPRLRDGSLVMVAPRAVVLQMTDVIDPAIRSHVEQPATPEGAVWCVYVHREHALAVPINQRLSKAGASESAMHSFFREWPETAHLASWLETDEKPSGFNTSETVHTCASLLRAFEEFLRIVDAMPRPRPGMLEYADRVRAILPQLRIDAARPAAPAGRAN